MGVEEGGLTDFVPADWRAERRRFGGIGLRGGDEAACTDGSMGAGGGRRAPGGGGSPVAAGSE